MNKNAVYIFGFVKLLKILHFIFDINCTFLFSRRNYRIMNIDNKILHIFILYFSEFYDASVV